MFTRRNLVLFLALAGLVAGLYVWRRAGSSTASVRVARAQKGNLVQSFRTNGVVEPVEFQEIRAEFPSQVVAVGVEEGDRVRKGQSLGRVDDRDLRAALAEARSKRLEAEQALARIRSASPLIELDAEIAQAKAQLDLAAAQLRRNDSLLKQKAIPQAEYDESSAAHRKPADRLAALEKRRAVVVERLRPLEEQEAQARVEQARVALANAQSRLRSASVPSPLAGTVLIKPPRPGTMLSLGDMLAKVGRIDRLQVRAYIDQPDFSSLEVGTAVEITSSGFPGERWKGKVVSLSAELSIIGKRVVGQALCSIDEGQHRLPVNSNVDLTFVSREVRGALLVPIDAVFQADGQSYAYVVAGGRLVRREVQVGPSNAESIVIRSGLQEGERVLNDLEVQPREGLRVEPR